MDDDHHDLDRTRPASNPRRSMRNRGTIVGVIALAMTPPVAAWAGCRVETLELPVKMVGSRAVATVGLNGTPVPLTVDSGAFFSILTDAAAAQLGLATKRSALRVEGITGKVDTRTTTVDKLKLFKGEIEHVDFVVGGNEPGAGTMGLMGRNILSFTDTEYDLAHGVIRFLYPNEDCAKSNMAYWAGSTPVTEVDLISEVRARLPAIRAQVKLNGREFVALFDTGATTVVAAQAARRAGVAEADLKPAGVVYGAGRGTAQAWIAPIDKFELGDETISNNRLRVADFEMRDADMLLGIDFFLSHRIYVSPGRSKMFVTYNGGPVFTLDRSRTATAVPAEDGQDAITTADEFARRGAASAARQDYASALADLDRACELEPGSAAFLAQRGAIHLAAKRPAEARKDFDRALEIDPAQVDARFRRAALRFATKDRDGARGDLDALDKALAPQAQMRLPMSQLYLRLEQPAQALAQLNQWLPAHPNEIRRDVALNERCLARAMLGVELDKALDDCDDAVDSDSKNAAYLDSRGWVYLRMGKYQKALADFDRSIEHQPANADSLYGRGLARTRLGDRAQGDVDLMAARKVQPEIDARLRNAGLVTESPPKP